MGGAHAAVSSRYRLALWVSLVLTATFACAPDEGSRHSFTIIQLNDVYEIFPLPARVGGEYKPRGGLAYVGTLVREARQRGPVLVLHAGDFLFPSLLSIRFKHKGVQMIEAMNALEVDLVTFGNNEFDLGCGVLGDRIRQSTFPWVSANVRLPPEMELPVGKILPYRVITVAGLRIGIFGLTIRPLAPVRCTTGDITFQDPLSAASAVVEKLERERVQLIVALTHQSMADDRALAASLPDIDLIVGGHDHGAIAEMVGKTLITKAGANATSLGVIDIDAVQAEGRIVVEKSWSRREVDPGALKPDATLDRVLAPYAVSMKPLSKRIGATDTPLDVRDEVVREAESNFGSYIADLIRAELRTDVALVNGGALRGDRVVPAGPLTLEDLETALMFPDRVVVIRLTGEQLRQALENGVSRASERDGRFPQVSGLTFAFDPDRPPSQRILRITVGDAPLERHRTYTLGTTDFLTKPGNLDGYTLPRESLQERGQLIDLVLRDLAKGPIKPGVDGRIMSLRQPTR
jgi:2',3'-cyclic-nucleotide 2'-phosphodiesterase (5'-nucleotidase family)